MILCRLSVEGGCWCREFINERKREKGEEEREEEGREQHRCQSFPVQCTETRANTTIRMSGEIVK